MNTYVIKFKKGREYLVCGETAREAAHSSMKYIEKVMEGCAVKDVSVSADAENPQKFSLKIEYYDRTAYNIRRLKNKPELLTIEAEMTLIDEEKIVPPSRR